MRAVHADTMTTSVPTATDVRVPTWARTILNAGLARAACFGLPRCAARSLERTREQLFFFLLSISSPGARATARAL
jgi:hypothetical protein